MGTTLLIYIIIGIVSEFIYFMFGGDIDRPTDKKTIATIATNYLVAAVLGIFWALVCISDAYINYYDRKNF